MNRNSLLQFYTKLIDNRIEYRYQPQQAKEKYPTVSSMGLQNKINKAIVVHASFDTTTFNPLHYKLDFFAKTTKVYRIDNSDYLLIVRSQ